MIPVLLFPQIDPVLIQVGPLAIHWYALAYITGLVVGWRLVRRLAAQRPAVANQLQVDDFLSWATLFPNLTARIRSVQPASDGDLLVCAESSSGAVAVRQPLALFRVSSTATALGAPLLEDPAWDSFEAVQAAAHRRPRGRLSNIDPARRTGQILCLNADYTTYGSREGGTAPAASRMRVCIRSCKKSYTLYGNHCRRRILKYDRQRRDRLS